MQSGTQVLKLLHEHQGHLSVCQTEAAFEEPQPKRKDWPDTKTRNKGLYT